MEPAALATLVADEFAWGGSDLAIGPHERLRGLLAKCGVDISAYDALGSGSKRTKLRGAVEKSPPPVRLRIVRAVLTELPEAEREPQARSAARRMLSAWVRTEEGVSVPVTASAQVRQVLDEFETLMQHHGPERAFDRLHSAFSAYLRNLHRKYVGPPGDKPLHKLLEAVAQRLTDKEDPDGVARTVLGAVKNMASALDTLRNKPAHGEIQKAHAEFAKDVLASTFRFLHATLGEGEK